LINAKHRKKAVEREQELKTRALPTDESFVSRHEVESQASAVTPGNGQMLDFEYLTEGFASLRQTPTVPNFDKSSLIGNGSAHPGQNISSSSSCDYRTTSPIPFAESFRNLEGPPVPVPTYPQYCGYNDQQPMLPQLGSGNQTVCNPQDLVQQSSMTHFPELSTYNNVPAFPEDAASGRTSARNPAEALSLLEAPLSLGGTANNLSFPYDLMENDSWLGQPTERLSAWSGGHSASDMYP
jgi:hypothetical protein